jgi:hypothetical protein
VDSGVRQCPNLLYFVNHNNVVVVGVYLPSALLETNKPTKDNKKVIEVNGVIM